MNLQRQFYQDLFSSRETISLKKSKYYDKLHNLPVISGTIKSNLEAPYTIDELTSAIQKSKQNKSPGPDGYSNEFFKKILEELKFWIFRYINEAIQNNTFSKLALDQGWIQA